MIRMKCIFASPLALLFLTLQGQHGTAAANEQIKIKEMKGQQVAVVSRGGADELALRLLPKARKLTPNYVGVTELPQASLRAAALSSGTQKFAVLDFVNVNELQRSGVLARVTWSTISRRIPSSPQRESPPRRANW